MIGRLRARVRSGITLERTAVLVLCLAVLLVHDVGYQLTHPFWTDEAWVAVTTRFPLGDLARVTSSTPIGWSFLLRLVPFGGQQGLRLVPIAFAIASVGAAYWFARRLGWPGARIAMGAGVLGAIGVLFTPEMLVRNDLKQYTADAFFALLLFGLTSRLEREWSRKNLAILGCTVGGGMLFSHTAAFVGVAVFGSVTLITAVRHDWRRLAETAVVGVATAVVMAAVYLAFDARAVVPGLKSYWRPFFVPVHGLWHFLDLRATRIAPIVGIGPVWLAVPIVVAGVVTVFRLGRPMTAVSFIVLWLVMFAASVAKRYPFLDLRTFTFLLAVTVVFAAIGVVGIASALRRWLRPAGAVALAGLVTAAFVIGASDHVRAHTLYHEDVRGAANYLASHAGPDDVILLSVYGDLNFAYYWPKGHPSPIHSSATLQGFLAGFPGQPNIVVTQGRARPEITVGLEKALALERQHPGARLWLVRVHETSSEAAAWGVASRAVGVRFVHAGPRGLTMVEPR